MTNPRLKSLTLPKISESLPIETSMTAVTIMYPIKIQSRYSKEPGLKGLSESELDEFRKILSSIEKSLGEN